MNSLEYWRAREEAALSLYLRTDEEIERKIHEIYVYLYDNLTKQINGFYQRYATAEGITMADAQQRVSKMDVEAFAAKAKKYVKEKDFSTQANQELRLYNATMRINRLELLKAEIGLDMVDSFNDLEHLLDEGLTDRALDELRRQAGILGESINNNQRWAREIVNASFHNATWSQRIWMYQTDLKNELSMLLTDGIIQGKNPRELAPHLSKMFGVSQRDAFRLMRTEMARVQEDAQKRAYNEAQIEQFVFIATEDAKTCELCGAMDGQIFDVKLMMPGENCAPMHPNCRCSTAAYIDRAAVEREIFGDEAFTDADKSGIINYAKRQELESGKGNFEISEASIINALRASESPVGLDVADYLESLHIRLNILTDEAPRGERGYSDFADRYNIYIYKNSLASHFIGEQTAIHEAIHLQRHIGGTQYAEAICMAYEKMYKEKRAFLFTDEWERIRKLAEDHYVEYSWDDGRPWEYEWFKSKIRERETS